MKWSWKIGSFAGIGVFVHWTFLLLIGWLVFVYVRRGDSVALVVEGVVFVLAIFACIVLHEFGHALAARRFGIRTRDITLLPIGGVARLERIPEEPLRELWVAVAGPLVNVAIAGVLFAIVVLSGPLAAVAEVVEVGGNFLTKLMWVNVALVVFNLIPAFPMDGGRVLRALLATSMDYVQATRVAATVGQLIAIAFGMLGLLFNPFLIFIALFVFLGAQQEAHSASIRSVMRGVPVREAMVTRFRTLRPDDRLQIAVEELLAGSQQDFPVLDGDRIVGLLTRDRLIQAISDGNVDDVVAGHMNDTCLTVEDGEMLSEIMDRMREHACSSLAVTHRGRLVGLLTMENIGELMMINAAMRRPHARGGVDDIFDLRD